MFFTFWAEFENVYFMVNTVVRKADFELAWMQIDQEF